MKDPVTVASVQAALSDDAAANRDKLTRLVREAAERGAHIILLPELFEGRYFPSKQDDVNFARARPATEHPTLGHFAELARELDVVLPVSFFEKSGPCYYNSVAILDADGEMRGVYRKSHIPDGPGYQEKFYFRPGDSGFRAWRTRHATIGVAICWDQWFPEAARAMTLAGADILFYPTAIGSEPYAPERGVLASKDPWQRVMIGHAVANSVAVVAANRIGDEGVVTFYGHSFIADSRGDKLAELDADSEGIITASFDLDLMQRERANWGFFRDRRPDLYGPLVG